MKKYEKPCIMDEEIEIEDVIASSSGGVTKSSSTDYGDQNWIGDLPWYQK